MPNPATPQQEQLVQIAKRHLAIEDVLVRDMRQVRRCDVAVWQVREALEAAFRAGQTQAPSHG